MKILHLCLANFYIDGYSYQENVLPRINKEDGHEVRIIASTETFIDNKELGYISPKKYTTEYGVEIERIQYKRVIQDFITHKVRKYKGLYERICDFGPDVIMCHDLCFGSVVDVIRYKKNNPEVKLYADTHTASYNSGLNWLSLNVLHRVYYRHLIQRALPYLEKYFYIGESERQFSVKNYNVPNARMEYFPLGGMVIDDEDYNRLRIKRREELKMKEGEVLYVHSGKLENQKRTKELLEAYSTVKDNNSRLIIIGSIPEDSKNTLLKLINKDDRVSFLGWMNSKDLQEYLCACDVYCQPGSVSATLQNAICNRCAILSYPHLAYTKDLDWGNFVWVKTTDDLKKAFNEFADNPQTITEMMNESHRCATELLDYRKLAARLYQ